MKKRTTLLKAIDIANALLEDITFMCKYRTKSTYFTRGGKMGFKDMILFMLNFVKKSLQTELDKYFANIKGGELSITKQSYSEAREKIMPEAFIEMTNRTLGWFYEEDDFRTYKGYRLSAVDGSIIEVNNAERMRKAFGHEGNKKGKVARAMISEIYDIENNMVICSKLTGCKAGERKVAIGMLEELKKLGLKNDLILFDRGYPSTELVTCLEGAGIKYLMRVSTVFLKAVKETKEPDQVIEIKGTDNKAIKMRVVRFMLESGVEEVLITNLLDKDFKVEDFKALYFKRWGIEIKYNELKNRILLENFTGDTPIAVKQDFYVSVYLANMAAIAKIEADESIKERNAGKVLKYEYKVNINLLIGKLKDNFVLMMLEEKPKKRTTMFKKIMKEISRNVVPIRPGRSFERKKGLRSNKFPLNQKRAL
jgi:hypothetical protein